MTEKAATFEFNGAKFKLAILLQNARSSPELYVKPDLYVKLEDGQPDTVANKVIYTPNEQTADSETIVLAKLHGAYVIIAGYNKVTAALAEGKGFKARFMSSVALKKAKIQAEPQAAPSVSVPTNRSQLRPEFANRRDPDNSYSRYSYARGRRTDG